MVDFAYGGEMLGGGKTKSFRPRRSRGFMRSLTLPIAPLVLCALVALCGPMPPASAAPRTIAVFDFELIDTSLEGSVNGPRADEQARLADVSNRLRERLAETGQFALADIAPIAA